LRDHGRHPPHQFPDSFACGVALPLKRCEARLDLRLLAVLNPFDHRSFDLVKTVDEGAAMGAAVGIGVRRDESLNRVEILPQRKGLAVIGESPSGKRASSL